MSSEGVAIATGCVFAGALCTWGAIAQVRAGETWGGTGKGKVNRAEEPRYFWYIFTVRVVLGPIALILGLIALKHR